MPNIAQFTGATPTLDNPNVYIDGISIKDINYRINTYMGL